MEREERARTLAITILQPRPIHSFSTTGSHLFTLSFWLSLSLALTHSLTNERTHLRFHLFALFRSYILYNFLSLHTHTRTHPHTHPHTPPYPHPHTPAHVKDTLTHTCTCSRTLFHSYTLVLSTHPITHTHSHTQWHTHSHTWALMHSRIHALTHSPIFSKECKLPTKCMIHISSLLCSKFHSLWLQNFPLRGSSSRSWGEPKYHSCGRSYKQIFRCF